MVVLVFMGFMLVTLLTVLALAVTVATPGGSTVLHDLDATTMALTEGNEHRATGGGVGEFHGTVGTTKVGLESTNRGLIFELTLCKNLACTPHTANPRHTSGWGAVGNGEASPVPSTPATRTSKDGYLGVRVHAIPSHEILALFILNHNAGRSTCDEHPHLRWYVLRQFLESLDPSLHVREGLDLSRPFFCFECHVSPPFSQP
jgi:hypothetical protein